MTRYVVTGTGRSGTGWCSAVLNSAGVFSGHENVFTPKHVEPTRLIDWAGYKADCSWLAVPRLPLLNVRAALVVRDPREVVASMLHIGFGHDYQDNDHAAVAKSYGMTPDTDGYLRFWVTWNVLAFPNVDAVFTLDQLLDQPMTLTRWAGAKYEPHPIGVINDRPEWKAGDRPNVEWEHFTDPTTVDAARSIWESLAVAA